MKFSNIKWKQERVQLTLMENQEDMLVEEKKLHYGSYFPQDINLFPLG